MKRRHFLAWRSSQVFLVVAAMVTLGERWCQAEPLTFAVTSERSSRAADCGSTEVLIDEVQRLSDGSRLVRSEHSAAIRAHVQFERSEQDYSAKLTFTGAKPGERILRDRGQNCRNLTDATAATIALLLDHQLEQGEIVPRARPGLASTLRIAASEVMPRAQPTRGLPMYLAVEGGPTLGFAPGPSASYGLLLGAVPQSSWRLEVGAKGWLRHENRFNQGVVSASLLAFTASVCRAWGNRWQLGPCLSAALGRLHGEGRGYSDSNQVNLFWPAIGASVFLERGGLGPLSVGIRGALWVPLREQSLAVRELGTAWTPSSVWFGVALRIGLAFH